MRRKVSAVSAKESAHTAQASQEAIRVLIPPSLPCPCSLVPDVTTPLYSTIVSQALRQPLRGHAVANFRECPLAEVPPALCIASVLFSRLSYVECRGFIACYTYKTLLIPGR